MKNITELKQGIRMKENYIKVSPAAKSESLSFRGVDSLKKIDKVVTAAICQPLNGILRQDKPTSLLFYEMVESLAKFFSISKATLIISDTEKDVLKMTTTWEKSNLRQGLWLTIPRKDSLLYRLAKNTETYSRLINGDFPGNFIESRILMDRETFSLLICPLVSNRTVRGLMTLASPVPFAFEMIEDGGLNPAFNRFATILTKNKY